MLQDQEFELLLIEQLLCVCFSFFFFLPETINQCAFSVIHLKQCSGFDEVKGQKNHFSLESERFHFKKKNV